MNPKAAMIAKIITESIKNANPPKFPSLSWFSRIVFWWIRRNDCSAFHTWTCNRLQAIFDLVNHDQFFWLAGRFNAADILTRGCTAAKLIQNKVFYNGPPFLKLKEEKWPSYSTIEGQQWQLDDSLREISEKELKPQEKTVFYCMRDECADDSSIKINSSAFKINSGARERKIDYGVNLSDENPVYSAEHGKSLTNTPSQIKISERQNDAHSAGPIKNELFKDCRCSDANSSSVGIRLSDNINDERRDDIKAHFSSVGTQTSSKEGLNGEPDKTGYALCSNTAYQNEICTPHKYVESKAHQRLHAHVCKIDEQSRETVDTFLDLKKYSSWVRVQHVARHVLFFADRMLQAIGR